MKILILFILACFSSFLHAQSGNQKFEKLTPEMKAYIEELYNKDKLEKQKIEEEKEKEAKIKNEAASEEPLEMHGYFRSGTNFFTTGGSRNGGSCFGLNYPRNDGLHYRYGNECRDYGEFSFHKWYKRNGVRFRPFFMTDMAGDSRNPTETEPWSRRTRQLFVEIQGIFGNQAALWVGRRYYRNIGDIGDIHVLDGFHVQSTGNGAGVTDVPWLGGMYNFAVTGHGTEDPNANIQEQSYLMDVRGSYGVGLNNYQFAIQNLVVTTAKGSEKRTDGRTITLQWQRMIGMLNNRVVGQYGQGSMAENPGCFGTDGQCFNSVAHKGADGWRVFTGGVFDFAARFKMHYLLLHQESKNYHRWSTASIRPHYMIHKYWAIVSDLGLHRYKKIDQTTGAFQTTQNLDQYTIALQASTDARDFWDRPAIRFYFSRFNWNRAAGVQSGLSAPGQPSQTHANVIGAQTEIWF